MRKTALSIMLLLFILIASLSFSACSDVNPGVVEDAVTVASLKSEIENAFEGLSDILIDSERATISFTVENEIETIDLTRDLNLPEITLTDRNENVITGSSLSLAVGANHFRLTAKSGSISVTYEITITRKAVQEVTPGGNTEDPTDPTIVEPTVDEPTIHDPTEPTEPSNPNEPSNPDDPIEPTDPTDPAVDPEPEHSHTYSDVWSKDSDYHWHAATCGHYLQANKALHQFGEWIVDYDSDYEKNGHKYRVCYVCNYIENDIILRKEKPVYRIIFDLNGGFSKSSTEPINVDHIASCDFVFDVQKENYIFRGWQYNGIKVFDENGSKLNDIVMIPEMTFVALFSDKVILTIVSNIPEAGFITNGGEYAYNTRVDLLAKPNQGYVFVGWVYQNAFLSKQESYNYQMWDKDIMIEARFALDAFELSLATNRESKGLVIINPTGVDDNYSATQTDSFLYTSSVTVAAYALSDARFLGWFDEKNQLVTTNAVYSFQMPNHSYMLLGKWDYFTITYELDGGINNSENPLTYNSDMDGIIFLNPTKNGVNFLGWKIGDEFVNSLNPKTCKDYVLTAVWSIFKGYSGNEKNILIEDGITIIGENAFLNNTLIQTIELPASLEAIQTNAFSGCTGLQSIFYQGDMQKWCNLIGLEYLMQFGTTNRYLFINGVKIEKEMIIPSTITDIADYAFYNCSEITSISIPNSVAVIGINSFKNCVGVELIEGGAEQVSDVAMQCRAPSFEAIISSGTSISANAFCDCEGLVSITLLSEIKDIGDTAFKNCSKLSSIVFFDGLSTIGNYAFRNCGKLISVMIPASITSIGQGAFYDCIELESIVFEENNCLGKIEDSLFFNCAKLNTITIPSNVKAIGVQAFKDCISLSSIIFDDNCKVSYFASSAFANCSSLTSISIPQNINIIDYRAFYECTALKTVLFDSNSLLTSIKDSAFEDCIVLESISIPRGIKNIGRRAFANCVQLETVLFEKYKYSGASLESIGGDAFLNCIALTSIIIPDSVSSIGSGLFNGCSSLVEITIPLCFNYFGNLFGTSSIDGFTRIQHTTSSYCYVPSTLRSIVLTKGFIIDEGAFSRFSMLTSISILQATIIRKEAFYGCHNLTSIVYGGTTEKWQTISKGTNWDVGTGNYTIHCTDGDIQKQ